MALEQAVVQALLSARNDPTLVWVLPVVLLKNRRMLDASKLVRMARTRKVAAELGMFLDLSATLGRQRGLSLVAKTLSPRPGPPQYYPPPLGGKYGRTLADQRTPKVVARWGFRMNATESDLRGFVRKHLG
jgi:hypothetical protein